jgi:hypothetical protein
MKIFNKEAERKKLWSISLNYDTEGCACLVAVDAENGEEIATIITFYSDGKNIVEVGTNNRLDECGYNPYEYNNTFDDSGRMIFNYE